MVEYVDISLESMFFAVIQKLYRYMQIKRARFCS
jgi:hypothetical protein